MNFENNNMPLILLMIALIIYFMSNFDGFASLKPSQINSQNQSTDEKNQSSHPPTIVDTATQIIDDISNNQKKYFTTMTTMAQNILDNVVRK